MPKYRVIWPEDAPSQARELWQLGWFERGDPRVFDLSPELANALKAKGFVVEELRPVRSKEVNNGEAS